MPAWILDAASSWSSSCETNMMMMMMMMMSYNVYNFHLNSLIFLVEMLKHAEHNA